MVMQRLVTPGQRVKENQVLLLLDDRLQAIESERRKVIFQDQSELVSVRERTKILSTLRDDSRAIFARTGSISKDELLRLDAEYLASKGRQEQLIEQKGSASNTDQPKESDCSATLPRRLRALSPK